MKNMYVTQHEAASLIRNGAIAVFAGSEDALRTLPKGRWIGGTTPYFMTEGGGVIDSAKLFCTVVDEAQDIRTEVLTLETLPSVASGRFADGFSYLLMPAFSDVHRLYAVDGPAYDRLCDQPVMGWVTGVLLSELGSRTPKVFDGTTGRAHDDAALVMHVRLPAGSQVELDIVNLFTQGNGPEIHFPTDGFQAEACTVDGKPFNFARYLQDSGADTKLPLVADYAGAQVNVAVQAVDADRGTVSFYAPVIRGESYRFAKPVADYAAAYATGLGTADDPGRALACNCILNFLYAALEGKTTAGYVGPVTFGEIAYVLLNQTLVRLTVTSSSTVKTSASVPEMA
jgi:hypothetical protein